MQGRPLSDSLTPAMLLTSDSLVSSHLSEMYRCNQNEALREMIALLIAADDADLARYPGIDDLLWFFEVTNHRALKAVIEARIDGLERAGRDHSHHGTLWKNDLVATAIARGDYSAPEIESDAHGIARQLPHLS